MTEARELLQNRADEGDEQDRNRMYYTDKQQRVLRAIVENPAKNTQEIGEIAGVHPSYVTYIIQRLPPEHATDFDWLREKAGLETDDDVEEVEETEESLVEEFGGMPEADVSVGGNGGLVLSATKNIPVTLTLSVPEETLQGEAMQMLHAAAKQKQENA